MDVDDVEVAVVEQLAQLAPQAEPDGGARDRTVD